MQALIKYWKKAGRETDYIKEISAEDFAKVYDENFHLLDVRKESEYDSQHIEGAENFPLDFINKNMNKLDRNTPYYLYCQGGYRSMITASILKARGFEKLVNIKGGFNALKQTQLLLTEYYEPVTLL